VRARARARARACTLFYNKIHADIMRLYLTNFDFL